MFVRIPKTGSSSVLELIEEQAAHKAFAVREVPDWDESITQLESMYIEPVGVEGGAAPGAPVGPTGPIGGSMPGIGIICIGGGG